jgi:hypothetical protein
MIADETRKLLKSEGHSDLTVNSVLTDHFLWDYRRKHAAMLELIPFHKTQSVFYWIIQNNELNEYCKYIEENSFEPFVCTIYNTMLW